MTFESLCEKMGYNPLKDAYPNKETDGYDGDVKSPFSVLSVEESMFMTEYLIEHRDEIKH